MKEKINSKKIMNGFTLGVTIGIFISIFVNFILKTHYFSSPTPQLVLKFGSNLATLISVLGYGSIGVFSVVSSLIFENDERSLVKSTLIHFILLQIFLLLIGYLFSWLAYYFILVLPISIFIYLIIWYLNYKICKKEIKSINSSLS